MGSPADRSTFLNIPETVSREAQEFLRTLQDPAVIPTFPEPGDFAAWKKLHAFQEAAARAQSENIAKRFSPTVTERSLNGIPVLDIRPKGWKDNGKVGVYTHGGGHVFYSAASTLGRAALFAHDTGLRVISIDYTVAPEAKFHQTTDQVLAVTKAILKEGRGLDDMVIYGDSSGGGLAAAATLKMRDHGLGLPAAAVLVSPWVDLTPSGDTEFTLRNAEPNYLYEKHSVKAAAAYADPKDQKHPHASPIYGDYFKGFPPTLIQGGTKEILLSGFVRLYQTLDVAGVTVKLDLYEGMPHNFISRVPELPESRLARRKIEAFVDLHLRQERRVAA